MLRFRRLGTGVTFRNMGLHTAARHLTPDQWDALSDEVFGRDGWACLARRLDPEAGPCRNSDGRIYEPEGLQIGSWRPGKVRYVRRFLTLQHVQLDGRTENDVEHLLTLCHGHHLGTGEKGGRIWSKMKEAARAQRKYLTDRYGGANVPATETAEA